MFEAAFETTEKAAADAAKSAAALVKVAKQLSHAARDGDILKLRRLAEQLRIAGHEASQAAEHAASSWRLTEDEVRAHLRDGFAAELIDVARAAGLEIRRLDDRLVASPSLIRALPDQRAVQIDRRKVTSLRPSHLVRLLSARRADKPRFRPEQFIEVLYVATKTLAGPDGAMSKKLADVYRVLTLLPGSRRDYSHSDFARDLYFLERSPVRTTKSGAVVSLPASTGTKSSRDLFTFVDAAGETVHYYSIKFEEPR